MIPNRSTRRSGMARALGIAALALPSAVVAGFSPVPLSGQSLLATGGLGVPVESLDARARALGSVGVGLSGVSLSVRDPASFGGAVLPTVTATGQYLSAEAPGGAGTVSTDATRFPHVGIAYPVSERVVAFLSWGGFLDQRWSEEREESLQLGGSTVSVTDRLRSDGGIAATHVGAAVRITEWLGIGVGAGVLTGSIRRTFTREFGADAEGGQVSPFVSAARWSTLAPSVAAGVQLDPSRNLRISGSLLWHGDLSAEPSEDADPSIQPGSYPLPLELRVGATGSLTPQLLLHVGFARADWTETGNALAGGSGGAAASSVGAGVEYTGSRLFGRSAPIRLGWRRSDFPFEVAGGVPEERAFSAGLGFVVSQFEAIPLASFDLAFERGARATPAFDEDFWRASLSLRLSGN